MTTEDQITSGNKFSAEKLPFFEALFFPRKGYWVTPVLIYINLLVFVLMVMCGVGFFEPEPLDLLNWGADFGPLTLTGDWWRTLTCNFVHIGIFHIAMNMYAFIYIGVLLEPLLGARRMFASYILTGLCSALCSLFWHGDLISAGASGAIFGLYGVFLSLLLLHSLPVYQRKALLASIAIFVVFNLANGINGNIDNAAHIGGLISGLVLGAVYAFEIRPSRDKSDSVISVLGEVGVLLIYIVGFIGLVRSMPSDYREFRDEWDREYSYGETINVSAGDHFMGTPITSKDQLPPYVPAFSTDTVLTFISTKGKFNLQYPTNWHPMESTPPNDDEIIFQQHWFNASNELIVTVYHFDTDEAYQYMKELSLRLPRNEKGEPSEDYSTSELIVNGNKYVKIDNQQHIGSPYEEGYEISQSVWYYFVEKHKMMYVFVMHINEDEAKRDLEAMMESVVFTFNKK